MEDPSLDGISDNDSVDDILEKGDVKGHKLKKHNEELDNIIKKQRESLSELDKLNKIKAYAELLEDNKKDKDNEDIEQTRGKTEKVWGSIYDPKYIKYAKEDTLNNKVMERLNSEIDFRLEDNGRIQIVKPFAEGDQDATEQFAKYEQTKDDNHTDRQHVPKKKQRKIGQRKSFY